MKWKTAWNRPVTYLICVLGVAVAIFGFFAAPQGHFLEIVFLIVALLYIVTAVLFFVLAYKAGKGT